MDNASGKSAVTFVEGAASAIEIPRVAKRRKLSLRGLHAFDAVARHGSFVRAAEELGVTQSAVSHQLRRLSEELGEKLVERAGRSISLTESGRKLAVELDDVFNRIERSAAQIVGGNGAAVRLAVCTCFAPGWLVPRLKTFYRAHPEIDLHISLFTADPDLTDRVADAFITSPPFRKGYWSTLIAREELVPVFAPSELGGNEVAGLPLIAVDLENGITGSEWIDYCQCANVAFETFCSGNWLNCSHYTVALEMARSGLGIALIPNFLVARDLARGSLQLLSSVTVPSRHDYYLCVKNSRRDEPALQNLIRWFRRQLIAN